MIVKKVVCFDFDGVIIHSSEVQRYAFATSYQEATGRVADEGLLEQFFSLSGDSLSNIFNQMGLPQEMIAIYRKVSIERSDKIRIHTGMTDLFENLKEQGFSCALCTGKDRERTLMILKELNIDIYFDEIVCSDDVTYPKPNPESLLVLMERLEVGKENIVMIGDANNDIKCAKGAGIDVIAVTWGDVPKKILLDDSPDYIVDKVSELQHVLKERFGYFVRPSYLFNDFVVAEDTCNLQCEYCLTQTSQFEKESMECSQENRKLSSMTYKEGSEFQENLDNIQHRLLEKVDVAVLKISGGEILMLPKIQDYVLKQAKNYKCVQILTNGVLLNKNMLLKYKEAGNICLQISLDHHTLDGNWYRTKDEKILNRIKDNMDLAYEIGIPIEINCVLTDRNTLRLSSFLDYLTKYDKDVIVYPFPVRGAKKDQYYFKENQLREIQSIIDRYDDYEKILAPKVYMEYLLHFMKTGKRKVKCSLPKIAVGTFEDGTVTPCPNFWFKSLGSLLKEKQQTAEKIGNHYIYEVLTGDKNPFKECKACFTPWETFNLYSEGIMSYQDLTKSPSYSFPGVKEYISNIQKK